MRPSGRFAPPGIDSPPAAAPPAVENSVADFSRPYRRSTPAEGASYGDPGRRRFRPPSTEELGGNGTSTGAVGTSEYAAEVSEAPRLPRSDAAPAPRFSGRRGAYDSRFRPPELEPGSEENR